jgi:hypothetical protein
MATMKIMRWAALAVVVGALQGQSITPEERGKAIAELERSEKLLLAAIEGISEIDAAKKPSAERWSVLECVEHMALTERGVFAMMQTALQAPVASEAERAKTKGKAEMLAKFMPDRSRRATAPVEVAPKGMFKTLAEARAAFVSARKTTIEFVSKTELPLHSHVSKHFAFGELDVYQWFVLMSAHVERHTKQVNEVKASW